MNKKNIQTASTKILLIAAVIFILIGVFFIFLTNKKVNEKRQPKIWIETFKNPIDPSTQPEEHKAVYEKIQKIVSFPLKYPERLPEGYKLVKVESRGSSGYFIYKKGLNEVQIFEGVGDIGNVRELEILDINPIYQAVLWESGRRLGITLYPQDNSSHTYVIMTDTHELRHDLIEIAKFLTEKF